MLEPPWSLRILDEAPLAVVAVLEGRAWYVPDDGPPLVVDPGDVAVVRGPDPYTIADDPATSPRAVIHPGQRCTTVAGAPLELLGVRTWGRAGEGATHFLTGVYDRPAEISQHLLEALPRALVVRAGEWSSPLPALLAEEVARDAPGQGAVLDRLLDVLLIAVLRTWFARPDAATPGWYRGRADPVVGPALALLQERPAEPWTVASLARAAHASRATFARRFAEVVGEPPMRYLTRWRLAIAADRLRDPTVTLGAVAAEVGYASPFALSAAFKRERGVSPAQHRAARAATRA